LGAHRGTVVPISKNDANSHFCANDQSGLGFPEREVRETFTVYLLMINQKESSVCLTQFFGYPE
jgi:hypothetical protein